MDSESKIITYTYKEGYVVRIHGCAKSTTAIHWQGVSGVQYATIPENLQIYTEFSTFYSKK